MHYFKKIIQGAILNLSKFKYTEKVKSFICPIVFIREAKTSFPDAMLFGVISQWKQKPGTLHIEFVVASIFFLKLKKMHLSALQLACILLRAVHSEKYAGTLMDLYGQNNINLYVFWNFA